MKKGVVCVICTALALNGCGSFSPSIEASAQNGNDVINDYTNYVVMTNVLLARDRLPASYTDLASISQTNSASASLSFTWPFGPLHGTQQRLTATPTASLSTTPSASVISLNNTGFVIAMMTPVNPLYLLGKWNNDRQTQKLLLSLLIKSIEFPLPPKPPMSDTNIPTIVYNDPNSPKELDTFDTVLNTLLAKPAFPKSITVMETVGPTFELVTTTIKKADNSTTAQDITGLGVAPALNDGQFHVGNAKSDSGIRGQLYHVYPSQVVFCSANLSQVYIDLKIKAPEATLPSPEAGQAMMAKTEGSNVNPLAFEIKKIAAAAGRPGSGSTSGSTSSGTTGAAPAGGGAASGAAPTVQLNQAMNVNRLTALSNMENCNFDEITIQQQDESDFATKTASFIRIEWRSPADVIDYLGALLRNASTKPIKFTATTEPQAQYAMKVSYQSVPSTYFIGSETAAALHVVTELVNMSKLASGTQISQPVLFIP